MDYVRLEIQFFVFQPYMGGRVPRKTESLQAYLIENNPLLIMEQNIGGNFSGAGMTRMSHTCPCPERSVSRYLLYESFEYPVQNCMMLFLHKVQKACRRSQHKVRNRQPRTSGGHVRDSGRVPDRRLVSDRRVVPDRRLIPDSRLVSDRRLVPDRRLIPDQTLNRNRIVSPSCTT